MPIGWLIPAMEPDTLGDLESNLWGTPAYVDSSIECIANCWHVRGRISTKLMNVWRRRANTSLASVIVMKHVHRAILPNDVILRKFSIRFLPILS